MRAWITFLTLWAVTATAVALWLGLHSETPSPLASPPAVATAPPAVPEPPPEPPPDTLVLKAAAFDDLAGWAMDFTADALPALLRSCAVFQRVPANRPLGPEGIAGTAGQWRSACVAADQVPAGDDRAARTFFEGAFQPYQVTNRGEAKGLFTGYYEPTLQGSRRKGGRFTVPLYRRPGDILRIDLGLFREEWEGVRLPARLRGGKIEPYPDRADIDTGAMAGRGLELVWVDDPIDAFFLHIQGSGRVELAEGGFLRVGYAGQNGHPYFAIGKELVARQALAREEVSMQSIRRWLEENPEAGREIMHQNPSYVFFQQLSGSGPKGSQGVELTPGRSLAVDRAFLPMGVPMWLDTEAPSMRPSAPDVPLQRLLVAQDTGGAIKGPVRGDVFWGPGEAAAEVAGRMKHGGRLWVLLPRAVHLESNPAQEAKMVGE